MAIMRQHQFPVQKVYVREYIDDAMFGNAELYFERDEAMRATIITMEQRMLAGMETEVRAHAKAETVPSVWAAVCVYWLAPLFAMLYDRLRFEFLINWEVWAALHVEDVEDTDTAVVATRLCPHIAVPDNQRHVQFLTYEGEVDDYGTYGN